MQVEGTKGGMQNRLDLPTVEKRTAMGVLFPICSNTLALQYLVISWVTSKYPKAPDEKDRNSQHKTIPRTINRHLWQSTTKQTHKAEVQDLPIQWRRRSKRTQNVKSQMKSYCHSGLKWVPHSWSQEAMMGDISRLTKGKGLQGVLR